MITIHSGAPGSTPVERQYAHIAGTLRVLPMSLEPEEPMWAETHDQPRRSDFDPTVAVRYKMTSLIVPGSFPKPEGIEPLNFTKVTPLKTKSHHVLGVVRGQLGKVDFEVFLQLLWDNGARCFEEAPWEDHFRPYLKRCDTEHGAEAAASDYLALIRGNGRTDMYCARLSGHLIGQALGDKASMKTANMVSDGDKIQAAYAEWRQGGGIVPEEEPYYLPPHIGQMVHQSAQADLIRLVRFAYYLGKLQGRRVRIPGFVGSAGAWEHWFEFPFRPATKIEPDGTIVLSKFGGYSIPDVMDTSLVIICRRFAPVLEACRYYGITFDLEPHPSERAIGDIQSAMEFILAMQHFGFGADVIGFNFDPSHMVWQHVDPVLFLIIFWEYIHSMHVKGVSVKKGWCWNGVLGGYQPMNQGDPNFWNFVEPGCDRDAVELEQILIALNDIGYEGELIIEWEDSKRDRVRSMLLALAKVTLLDVSPSEGRHDDTLKVEAVPV